jgi:hypothetical protein
MDEWWDGWIKRTITQGYYISRHICNLYNNMQSFCRPQNIMIFHKKQSDKHKRAHIPSKTQLLSFWSKLFPVLQWGPEMAHSKECKASYLRNLRPPFKMAEFWSSWWPFYLCCLPIVLYNVQVDSYVTEHVLGMPSRHVYLGPHP